jgi:DNA-binding NtrC family response regulator
VPDALVVDDDPGFQDALARLVRAEGFAVETAATLEEARGRLEEHVPDLALVDLNLPDGSGLDLIRDLEPRAHTDIVLVTGNASVDSAVAALLGGASDYLTKPVDERRLRSVLLNVARRRELRQEIDSLRTDLRSLGHYGPLIGVSASMQHVYDLIERVAATEATVLLLGESGTGKELVAQTIHAQSRRRDQSFVPVNCGAVSPGLIESELFGHERGSFTGAERTHRGFFERAAGGTLFLDEISEMPPELQVRLLRVLETGNVSRVGGERDLPIDVRVIAASNVEPAAAVRDGKLREDLLYRLSVFPIRLPPLRERPEDIELLAEYFLSRLNETSDLSPRRLNRAAVRRLRSHAWPGNVRELANAVQRAFILADDEIDAACLPAPLRLQSSDSSEEGPVLRVRVGSTVAEAERRLILATLEECGGNKDRAARLLGISLKTLYNKLNRYRG